MTRRSDVMTALGLLAIVLLALATVGAFSDSFMTPETESGLAFGGLTVLAVAAWVKALP